MFLSPISRASYDGLPVGSTGCVLAWSAGSVFCRFIWFAGSDCSPALMILFWSSSVGGPVGGGSVLSVTLIVDSWFGVLSSWVPVGECLLEVLSISLSGLLSG